MPADVKLRRWTGAAGSETKTDVTGGDTRAIAEDAHSTSGTQNSVLVPASGTHYSYWVTLRLYAATAPANKIDNIRAYTDGGNNLGTGLGMNMATASSYVQATGTKGRTGKQLTTGNHGGLNASPADAFGYTSSSPLSVSGSTTGTGDFGDFLVYQIEVSDTAGTGASSSEPITIAYDES